MSSADAMGRVETIVVAFLESTPEADWAATAHTQVDIPLENVLDLFAASRELGRY